MKRSLILFALLLLSLSSFLVSFSSFSFAGPVPRPPAGFAPGSLDPRTVVLGQIDPLTQIVLALIATLIMLAAFVYLVGQAFGAETRARATAWAMSLLSGAGLSAVLLAMLYVLLPNYRSGSTAGLFDIPLVVASLASIAQMSLFSLIMTLIILAALIYLIGQAFPAETRAHATVWANVSVAASLLASVAYVLLSNVFTDFRSSFFVSTGLSIYANLITNVSFFVTCLILITYLLSKVFKIPEWEAYLGIELGNLANSYLVVIFAVAFMGAGLLIARQYVVGATSPTHAVISSMRTLVSDNLLKGIYDVYQIQACTSVLSTYSKRIGEYVLTQTFKVFPGIDTFVSITNALAFGLVSIYGSINAQISVLYALDSLILNFLLPAGLILRFIPTFREAGTFIIALALGFYVIYPISFLINVQIYHDIGGAGYETPALLIQSICGPFKYGFWGFALNPAGNPLFSSSSWGQIIGQRLSSIVSEGYLNAISMSEFVVVMRHLSSLSLPALFMPALSLTITIAFINNTTKFLLARL